jgi:hypothetical protein
MGPVTSFDDEPKWVHNGMPASDAAANTGSQ